MIFKRLRNGRESTHWYCKVEFQGKQYLRNTRYTAKPDAERFERALRKALAGEREQAVAALDASRLRAAASGVTIAQVIEAFQAAPGEWTPQTKRGYVGGLRAVVETTLGTDPAWDSRPVSALTNDLVYRYRQAVLRRAGGADAARVTQLSRSANTCLRSARALFAPTLIEYYRRQCGLQLPDLSEFRSCPGFKGVAKVDYHIPSDALIRRTMEDLERTRATHPDRYASVWLALGFGLRRSEAAAVRAGWFVRLNGRIHLELREVVQPGTPGQTSGATKNGTICPRIPVANGAWEHLEPLVSALRPEQHVIAPDGTPTYRVDHQFDDLADWLRALGWETDKAYHEFRALAGCWVAMRDGLLVARDWLRHSSVTTTERHYGRYVRTQVTDARWDTVVDTGTDSRQTIPTVPMVATFGSIPEQQTTLQSVDFQSFPQVNACGPVVPRP
jgi:integrase